MGSGCHSRRRSAGHCIIGDAMARLVAWVGTDGGNNVEWSEAYRRACGRGCGIRLHGRCLGTADRQDRSDLSPERQCCQRRQLFQGGYRVGGRHRQQQAPRAEGHPACRRRRPSQSRWRQDPGDLRRQPGHARGRPEPGPAPHHRREGQCPDRLLPIGHHGHRQRHGRAPRHSVPDAGIGGVQSDRARLQVVLPRHAGRRRLRQGILEIPHRTESRRDRRRAPLPSFTRTPSTATRSAASSRTRSSRMATTSRR